MKQKVKINNVMLLTMFVFILISCKNNSLKKEISLSANNKLWQVDRPKENLRGVFTYYKFGKNGEWLVYRRNKNSKVFERPNMGDIELIETWKLINDSTINVGGLNYKILILND